MVRLKIWFLSLIARACDGAEQGRLKALADLAEVRTLGAERELAATKEQLRKQIEVERQLRELEIPTLERKLEVEKAYSSYLATLHEKELARNKAEIAVSNARIVDNRTAELNLLRGT